MLTATYTSEMQSVMEIAPSHPKGMIRYKNQKMSYKLVGLVVLLHMLVLFALLRLSQEKLKVSPELTTMTVSLISHVITQQQTREQPRKGSLDNTVKPNAEDTKEEIRTTEVIKKVITENSKNDNSNNNNSSEIKSVENVRNAQETKQEESIQEAVKTATTYEEELEPPKFGAAYLNNPAPEYPKMARRSGQQGRVMLKVLVAENGKPQLVELATSSGYEALDQAAIEAVKLWRFIAAKRNNQPISANVLVPVKFSLNS